PFRFAEAIEHGGRIDIYNYGRMWRDFTYVDDIVEGVVRILDRPPAGHQVFNVGNSQPVHLLAFVRCLERALGRRARHRFLPMQPGDVLATYADVEAFQQYTGFRPGVPVEEGVQRFADWYRGYYGRAASARVA
ncbi:MAG: hypothetical protein RL328_2310, partial [Acidobacteriota bacterium]